MRQGGAGMKIGALCNIQHVLSQGNDSVLAKEWVRKTRPLHKENTMIKLVLSTGIVLIGIQAAIAQSNDVRKLVKDAFASNDQIQVAAHLDQAYQKDTEDFVEELAFVICYDKQKAQAALPLLSKLIERHPDDKYLYHLRGCGKIVLGDYDNCLLYTSRCV